MLRSTAYTVRPRTRELSKTPGKNADLSAQLGPINEELTSNRESNNWPVKVKQIRRISDKMTDAKQSGNDAPVSSPAEDSFLYRYRYKNFAERELKAADKDLIGEYLMDLVETIGQHAVEMTATGQFNCMIDHVLFSVEFFFFAYFLCPIFCQLS